ncbi:DUF4232 domain-containing protein [Streptomyces somaliensis]|uniref:DUF4232 domain-containing protein n=2 Tax=Streptomyces somaliensis TaxID=78355 RepID=A0AA44IBG1_STRE0|nr:DUF4232 domain-containing protein [Streptomyces somaliensis]NKY12696.1 DUF4232 domain-containing protein [Streptomyces somaliensis DSM 40738]
MRTFRTRTTAAAATALLAALPLTACQSGGSDNAGAASGTPAVTAPAPAPAGDAVQVRQTNAPKIVQAGQTNAPKADKGDTPRAGRSMYPSTGNRPGALSSFTTCTGDNMRIEVAKPTRPINHLLITATNTGSRTCLAYGAPILRFDDEQATPGLLEDSRPQAVVTVPPGRSAYAAVVLSGERAPEEANGRITERLQVLFSPRNAPGSIGSPVRVKLPADTYKTDDAATTYWQQTLDDALGF